MQWGCMRLSDEYCEKLCEWLRQTGQMSQTGCTSAPEA